LWVFALAQGIKLDDDPREHLRALAEAREDMARWETSQLNGKALQHVHAAAWLQKQADGGEAAFPKWEVVRSHPSLRA
jgi:predicted transcriptional regulator